MKSRADSVPDLLKVHGVAGTQSHVNEEIVLDVPFRAEEVTRAIARLKSF